jgi:CBS domain-containing protein
MKVGELCTRSVFVAWREETVVDVAHRMRSAHVGDVVLVTGKPDDCVPIGVVTDRDLVVAALAQAPGLVAAITLGDLLIRPLVTVREDAELESAIAAMRHEGVHRLPVVDDAGQLVGILSRDDVLEFLAEQLRDLAAIPEKGARTERATRT